MSKVVRSVKNVTKGYTHAQVKVRNATSNDSWGPVGSDMAEIAQLTFADTATFYEIMDILDKRLNDKGKNWRHVLKSLKVLDYCLHEGSELVVTWARENIYIIKTLREFQHIDDEGRDVGQNIRVSAKELTSLILDEERLRTERRDRKSWKSRVSGLNEFDNEPPKPARRREPRPKTDEEDLEMRLAIEASKNEAEEDAKRRAAKSTDNDDDDLAKAIKLSKEEEELRRKELEEANANSLFDDTPTPQAAAVNNTGWNQGYQQQPTVDWFGNVIDPQAQQNTGYPTAQSGYYVPQQNMAFIPQQQTAFQMNGGMMNNPYSQQSNGMGMLGSMQNQPQLSTQPQEPALQPGSNNPWAGSTNAGLDASRPLATGSNNPFATNRPHSAQALHRPTLNTLQEQKTTTAFNPIMNFSGGSPSSSIPMPEPLTSSMSTLSSMSSSQQSQLQQQQLLQQSKPMDPHAARLNALLAANDSGLDTFGNVGETRIPAQHTAPGTFVNSAGLNLGRLTGQAGSANPFMAGQFTGMPQTRVPPAQTGNPFGAGRQQSGNLIDL